MAVSFTIWDYWGELLLLTFGSPALFLVTAVPLMRFLVRRTKNVGIAMLPVLLILPMMAAAFTYLVPIGEQSGCLYPEENAYTHTTAGTITALRPADHIPLYHYDGEFRGGVYLTIEGTEYYSMAHPMLTVGTSLHFTYCPEDDLIVAFSPIEPGEIAALQAPFVMPEPVPEEPVPKLQGLIGAICTCAGFLGFALLVWQHDRLTLWATARLLAKDREQRGAVIPNPSATAAVALLPICLAILGGALSSNSRRPLFILLLGAPMMLFYPRLTACHVRLEGRNIRIRRFGRERLVPLSSLQAVYWSEYKRSFSQRKLVLAFDSWTLELEQDSHLGLSDLHRRLSALLHITH